MAAIRPIDSANRPFFAGEVSGIDLTRRLSDAEVAAIHEIPSDRLR